MFQNVTLQTPLAFWNTAKSRLRQVKNSCCRGYISGEGVGMPSHYDSSVGTERKCEGHKMLSSTPPIYINVPVAQMSGTREYRQV
jgi:hypothetical protein